jgi:hypothetical protein
MTTPDAAHLTRAARHPRHAVRERRSALQLLRMTIVSAPEELRNQVRHLTRMQLIRTLAAWRPDVSNATDPVTAYRFSLKSLARRYLQLTYEIADLDEPINSIVEALAPRLLERVGIGIEVAGQLLVTAGDNPGDEVRSRVRDALRRFTPARVLGNDTTASAQPRRRPPSQPRPAPRSHQPDQA